MIDSRIVGVSRRWVCVASVANGPGFAAFILFLRFHGIGVVARKPFSIK
jgi:hypothetical protein